MPEAEKILKLSDFDGLINETFVFSLDGVEQKIEGVLIKAEAMKSGSHSGENGDFRHPFILDFRFPPGADIAQGLFQVETEKAERLPPMFLVPRASDESGWYMDATFN